MTKIFPFTEFNLCQVTPMPEHPEIHSLNNSQRTSLSLQSSSPSRKLEGPHSPGSQDEWNEREVMDEEKEPDKTPFLGIFNQLRDLSQRPAMS